MANDPSERITQWLRDAHAMETEAETMLTAMAGRIESYPVLKQRIEQHIHETKGQAARIEARLHALGSSPATAKDMVTGMMASVHAMGQSTMSDEVLKGFGVSYAFEHMEIGAYRNLLFAAEALGDMETAQLCRDTLPEEQAMADWLLENQQSLVQQFLALDVTEGESAKR
jgi:ferritin-like metal-binding protein YciE